jgi:ribosomal protein S17E
LIKYSFHRKVQYNTVQSKEISNEICRINPAGKIASDRTRNAVAGCLTGAENRGEARPGSSGSAATRSVEFGEEHITSALVASVPNRPQSLVQRHVYQGVFENNPGDSP